MDLNHYTKKKLNKKKTTTSSMTTDEEEESSCYDYSFCCFFCAMKEPNPRLRRSAVTTFFHEMPHRDDQSHVLVMSALWNIAMTHPEDPELPMAGALRCMSLLVTKALADPTWLLRHQNIYIPYYAAHVVGSYTIRLPALAALAVESGAVAPLIGLLRGTMTWVEQRVAVRAIGHLASYDTTFPAVLRHADELVPLAMQVASTCLDTVYKQFVGVPPAEREQYHRDLLTRGLGGTEMENRKAEEWASQLQCWCLYLLSCFAFRDKTFHDLICRDVGFLKDLCRMWGGLVNGDSPAGVGLMRILCRSEVGREAMAGCREVVTSLCDLSRSSDDWQYMGIDCLLYLIEDLNTRRGVMEAAAPCLVDLVELRSLGARRNLGDRITKALLLDFDHGVKVGTEAERTIKSLWELKMEREKREEVMPKEEVIERQALAAIKKQEGNERFWSGDVEEAIVKYTEALELCPLKRRKERLVLHSNRAQCYLLLREPDAAISDATRALALACPANGHGKSLWRRSQAYDMKGMAKESLMDCILFVNGWFHGKDCNERKRRAKVPYYAARMINKQMDKAGLFASLATSKKIKSRDGDDGAGDESEEEIGIGSGSSMSGSGLPTILEEPWLRKAKKGLDG
ncbi:Tetratricopeptide repeat protein 1 [Cocos nucifera]|uniref:Tetratricopeptide repeat protein 1 n=1 Tax=Cocos nucifera TaxID=13894 RepID=A0A8K0I7T2_COCNU|nr:Tetratricopeptide repeat protein 1 [Cocos nucifera]